MNAYKLMMKAEHQIEHGDICLGEYAQIIALLKDVEPVVRCKDCKYRDPEDKRCDCGHDILWQLSRDDDWFCADGERKRNEPQD